jgi:alcohol dehydrogenase class IV
MEMRSFQHVEPPLRLFAGPDGLRSLGRELDRLNCRRAMIFCGSSLARVGSPLALIRSALGERCAGVFAGVRPHSPVPAVKEGARELKRLEADAVVAVGGGSAIVTARAASILLAEGDDVEALCTSQDERGELRSPKLLAPKLPQLVVPTTPNTATAKAGSAVFDPVGQRRLALFDPKTRAQSVFLHPELLMSAPRDLVVGAALDTLVLAVEGLTSRSGDAISDALLMHAVRLLSMHLADPALDAASRGELAIAALLCGRGTDHTGAGVATVLGHAIGPRHKGENAIPKVIVLPHSLRFNAEAAESGLAKLAESLGVRPSDGEPNVAPVVGKLEGLFTRLGVPQRLRDIDIARDVLPEIAASGMDDWFLRGNPRPVRAASELQGVLEQAW